MLGRQISGHKKVFFYLWSAKKPVLMHLRILPGHQVNAQKKGFILMPKVVKNKF
jgi:hypothetical protein